MFAATLTAIAQVPGQAGTLPLGKTTDSGAITTPCCEATRVVQLLHAHPELLPVVKSYLARQMDSEGAQSDEHAITDAMVYSRLESDPVFARNVSQWLVSLAQATTKSLESPVTEAEQIKPEQSASPKAQSAPSPTGPGSVASGVAIAEGKTETLSRVPSAAQPSSSSAPTETRPAGVSSNPPALAPNLEPPALKVTALPKYLLQDQIAFWTLPFHLRAPDLTFLVPASFGTALLIGSDTAIESHLPTSSNTIKLAANGSTAGALGLVGVGGGLFLVGSASHNEHQRETGFLVGEAAIDAYADSTALQYITQRERPFTGNNKGSFFSGGNSFPSNTAAVAWASASVIAHEYPGFLTQLLAYGAAGGVTAGRVIGQKHWTSDAVIGSALGWYMGRQIYRARGSGADISAANWGTFEKSPDDTAKDPAYMGSTYVALDSWVYPLFDRLAALGYLPTETVAIRPWPRLECARLVLEAEEQLHEPGGENSVVGEIVAQLKQEFAREVAQLGGETGNVSAELDSAYVRVTEISGRALRDSYNFAQTLYDDFGRPYGRGFNTVDGAAVRAEAGPLAFYFRGEFQHSSSLPNYTPYQAQQVVNSNLTPTLPISSVPTFNGVNQFRPIEAYVALNVDNWQISFGYQNYWWGPDKGTSLMFSDNARSEPMLKFGRINPFVLPGFLAYVGQIRNTIFFGALPDYYWLRGPYPDFPVYGNPYHPINPLPYTWGDRVAVKVTQNLELGGALSVVWAGYGRPATLETWLHTFNSNGNTQPLDPGKRYTGFDVSYRVPGLRDWLTFYVDGMANDQPNPINSERQSAWNPGIYFPKLPRLPKLDLRVEAVYTNLINYAGVGRYYSNEHYAQGYTIENQIIGSWVGRQGDGIQAWATYWVSPRRKIQLAYRRQWVDPALLGGGGLNDFSANVDWLFKHDIDVSSAVQYERWNFPLLDSSPVNNVSMQLQLSYTPSGGRITGKKW